GKYLFQKAQNKKLAVKLFLMDSHVVVGVGNIYANEALFAARIHPLMPVNELTLQQWDALCKATKIILRKAIKKGGTTLKDFVNSEGKPGYFKQQLKAYGQNGQPCPNCKSILELTRIAQRATVHCPSCQKK
ncbi:MAG TPA: zinc finger domain-containing protein, partial [Gammaproteobacteria bacterium]|nr:zinc finger domain-containing protein [Gammaproteobacteria bacterium]